MSQDWERQRLIPSVMANDIHRNTTFGVQRRHSPESREAVRGVVAVIGVKFQCTRCPGARVSPCR